jgi:hypothetical protein
MAVELRNWIEGELRVNVPVVELMRSPSLSRLAGLLAERFSTGDEPGPAPHGPVHAGDAHAQAAERPAMLASLEATPEALLERLGEMSGEQVDALLDTLLNSNPNEARR